MTTQEAIQLKHQIGGSDPEGIQFVQAEILIDIALQLTEIAYQLRVAAERRKD